MNNIRSILNKNRKMSLALTGLIFALIFVTIILFIVEIQNKVEEGRYIGKELTPVNTITVSGEGEIYAKPDLSLIDLMVKTEAKTVAAAMELNSQKMNKVIEAVKAMEVVEGDLQTKTFNIYPRYEWQKSELSIFPEGKRVLVGYEVQQELAVKIRNLTKIGSIIQGATEAGANQIGDLQLLVDKEETFKAQAREEAIQQAKEKAQSLASQLGVRLGQIINFQEQAATPYFMSRLYGATPALKESADVTIPEIEVGENKIRVEVGITYELL
jgi:uncharacterized protein YggE